MVKFKIGDRVISKTFDGPVSAGDLGSVSENGSKYPFVLWDIIGEDWAIEEDDLELHTPKPQYEIY